MKKFAKLLVLLLTVALICGAIAMVASAEDQNTQNLGTDITSEIENAAPGSTVTLTGNSYLPAEVTIAKNLTIDLKGYTLTLQAANAFKLTGAYEFKINGNYGTIDLYGTLTTAANGIAPTVEVNNVSINHYGTARTDAFYIVDTYAGKYTFNGVDIKSTAPITKASCNTQRPAFFMTQHGNTDTTKIEYNNTDGGADMNFNAVTFVCETSLPTGCSAWGGYVFVNIVANGHVNVIDSYIKNAGAICFMGYAEPKNAQGEIDGTEEVFYAENSSLINEQPIGGAGRGYAFYGHRGSGANDAATTYGTVNLKDSYMCGTYRVLVFGGNSLNNVTFNLDHSVIRNGGGVDTTPDSFDVDTKIVRCVNVYARNNSTIISRNSSLAQTSGNVYVEEGTSFNNATVATGCYAYDFETKTASSAKIASSSVYYDPTTNANQRYVYKTSGTNVYAEGVSNLDFIPFEYLAGSRKAPGGTTTYTNVHTGATVTGATYYTPSTQYGVETDNSWNYGSTTGASPTTSSNAFGNYVQYQIKSGSFTDVTYGNNASVKYWVSPIQNDANSKLGTIRNYSGSYMDTYFVFGDKSQSKTTDAFAQTGVSNVVIYSIDVATDSEYGYPETNLIFRGRTNGTNKPGATWGTIKSDGTVELSLTDKPESGTYKLSTTEWNTITVVGFISDGAKTQGIGFVYINGEYVGYNTQLYASDAGYFQGLGFNPKTKHDHTVGQSILFDNLTRTRYDEYLEADTNGTSTFNKARADMYAPAYVKNTNACNDNIIVGGNAYANLADAIDAATEKDENTVKQVLPINVFASLDTPTLITSNITVFTHGNTIAVADGSYPALINGDKKAPTSYVFDVAYNEYVIQYWWLRPGYTPEEFDDTWFDEPDKYFYVQELKAGMIPDPGEDLIHNPIMDIEAKTAMVHKNKWSLPEDSGTASVFEPLSINYVMEVYESEAPVMIAPYYEEVSVLYYVTDADGVIVRVGSNDAEFTEEFTNVVPGKTKTVTLLGDVNMTTPNNRFDGGDYATVTGLNLNGNKLEYKFSGTIAVVGSNMTLNIYSTTPGAEIYHAWYNGSRIQSQRSFAIHGTGGENIDTANSTHDAHINIGTVEGIEGSNGKYLSLYASVIVEGMTGNDTCSIVVDGIHAERIYAETSAMVMTRYYNGDIIIKNSTLINYGTGSNTAFVDMKGCGNDDAIKNNPTGYNDPSLVLTPYVLFDSCNIVHLSNANLIGNNGDGYDGEFTDEEGNPLDVVHQLEFRNCVISCTNGKQINGSNQDERTVFTGTNIISQLGINDPKNFIEGQSRYEYYAPVTLASLGLEDKGGYAIFKQAVYNGTDVTYTDCAIVEYGATLPEGVTAYKTFTLPQYFKHAAVTSDKTINVSWKDMAGNDVAKKYYYAGPTEVIGNGVLASAFTGANAVTGPTTAPDYTEGLVATKYAFTAWDKAATNVTVNTVINAQYELAANVENVKANISLYSDFDVNLYIPEKYRDLVTVMYGEKTLDKLTTAREGYFKVTVDQLASEAASDVQFVVTVTEAGETFTLNYSVNVATYAKYVIENEGYTLEDKTLMRYVIAYANEAYKYANGGNANETLNTLATAYPSTPVEKTSAPITNPAEISAVVKETNVILQSAPKFQFTIDKAFVGTVVIGGTAYTYETADEADRVVTVEGTRAYNFLDDITIKVGEYEGKYNFSAYVWFHYDNAINGTDEESKAASANALALINALYEYANYAKTYNANKA